MTSSVSDNGSVGDNPLSNAQTTSNEHSSLDHSSGSHSSGSHTSSRHTSSSHSHTPNGHSSNGHTRNGSPKNGRQLGSETSTKNSIANNLGTKDIAQSPSAFSTGSTSSGQRVLIHRGLEGSLERSRPSITNLASLDRLLQETSMSERELLRNYLTDGILHFTESKRPVYLDRLGFFIPTTKTKQRVRTTSGHYIIRDETTQTLAFDKCSELSDFHRETYPTRVEINELAKWVYPRLPIKLNLNWNEDDVRGFLAATVKHIQRELILSGISKGLEPLGSLYCLQNRQGSTLPEWYAGADIFFESSYKEIIQVSQARHIPMPILETAWEPFEATYGAPINRFTINPSDELVALGFMSRDECNEQSTRDVIEVAAFKKFDTQSGQTSYLYCSNGLRRVGLENGSRSSTRKGVEFVFQVFINNDQDSDPTLIEELPRRALTMAWVLLQGSKNGQVLPGAAVSCEAPLIESVRTSLNTIITAEFTQIPGESSSEEGSFTYVNVVGITADEALIASSHTPAFLVKLLKHKSMDQLTRPERFSIVRRTEYEAPEAGEAKLATQLVQ